MDRFRSHVSVGALLVVAVSVSGCLRIGGGGGGGGGAADLDARFDEVKALMLTTDMPTELNATYDGGMKVGVRDTGRTNTGTGGQYDDVDGIFSADLSIEVAWNESMSPNANISGSASNFKGTFYGEDGERNVDLGGSLTVTPGSGGIVRTEITPAITLPSGLASGAIQFQMTGGLTDPDSEDDSVWMSLLLGGNFYGSGAEAAYGTVSGTLYDDDQLTIPGGAASGEFYLKKKP